MSPYTIDDMAMTIPVLYRDDDLIVVDKPAGVLCVPDRYDPDAPVAAQELAKTEGELFVVHRIDKDTTGVLIYARNAEAHRILSLAFEERKVNKTYRAIVRGSPLWDETVCELSLRTDGDRLHRTLIDEGKGSKEAKTAFTVIERFKSGSFSATLVEAKPETGGPTRFGSTSPPWVCLSSATPSMATATTFFSPRSRASGRATPGPSGPSSPAPPSTP